VKKSKDMRQIIPSPPARQTEPYMSYPLTDIENQRESNAVSIPPLSDIIDAKEWVDHNQK